MSLSQRISLYQELEQARERPLIVYVTSLRPGAPGIMAADAIPEFLDQIESLPKDSKRVDMLVVSNGGDPTVAWRVMSLLRERVDHVSVLVPQAAFSAATMMAMGADEIVMHPNGNLGPVDVQIGVTKPGSPEQRFGFEDLTSFLDFAKDNVGLKEEEHLRSLFSLWCNDVGPVPVGVAARSARLTMTMGEALLRMHMKDAKGAERAKIIAEKLNKSYFYHGYPVSRREARDLGLEIAEENKAVESLMWSVWRDIEAELQMRKVFSAVHELMASTQAGKLLQARQPKLPGVLPPTVTQQLVQNIQLAGATAPQGVSDVLNRSIEATTTPVDPVDFETVGAVMESRRLASRHVVKGKLISCRMPDLNIQINAVPVRVGWEPVSIPSAS